MPSFFNRRARPARNAAARPQAVAPMYNLATAEDGRSAELVLFGDVLEQPRYDWLTGERDAYCISIQQVVDDLSALGDVDQLTVRLNSSGGDVFAGIAIHNALKGVAAGKTVVVVEGLAASAASVIMCAGDEVRVHPSSMVMIHSVSAMLWGYYSIAELNEVIRDIEAPEKSLRAIYAAKAGIADDEAAAIMGATTWYVGQEAVDAGFADAVIGADEDEQPPALDASGEYLMVAGVRHAADRLPNMPGWIASGGKAPIAAPAARSYTGSAGEAPGFEEKEETLEIKNLGELRAAYPDLVAEAERAAGAAERERIKAIDAIASSVPAAMVDAAKFDEPMTAAELALAAMEASAAAGRKFIADAAEDEEESGAADVDADPAGDEGDDEDKKEDEELANMLSFYNKSKKGMR